MVAQQAGDLKAAERLFRQTLARAPESSEALHLLGVLAFTRRDFVDAERFFARAINANEKDYAAFFNLGKTYEVMGRFDTALAAYGAIPEQTEHYGDAMLRTGVIRYAQWHLEEAASAFETAIALQPQSTLAIVDLGIVYNHLGRFEDGLQTLRSALAVDPKLSDARRALADVLRFLGRIDESIAECQVLLETDPDDALTLLLLGRAMFDKDEFEEAENAFVRAARAAPERHEPRSNLNVLYHVQQRLDAAIVQGEAAIALAPLDSEAHINLGMSYLMSGDFARGWPLFEWRLHGTQNRDKYPYRDLVKRWSGESLGDGKLLVSRDQGVGDFILFSRLFPMVKARGLQLFVECPPEIAPLYRGFPGVDRLLLGTSDVRRAPHIDAQIPLGSLPLVLKIDTATIPSAVPYLRADIAQTLSFRERFAALGIGRKVGIVWAGSPKHGSDRYRSCNLSAFAALAGVPNVRWISLQKGPAQSQLELAPFGMNILDLSYELTDYSATAAAISALDLVITVDTSVAHLAGALGKAVWTLLGFETFWLWQTNVSTTPWYPTMRLFRQPAPNAWDALFSNVRTALST
jgi:tetratricopeptide (TPR) repeat protein